MASSLREFGGAYEDEERKPLNSSLQTSVFSPSTSPPCRAVHLFLLSPPHTLPLPPPPSPAPLALVPSDRSRRERLEAAK